MSATESRTASATHGYLLATRECQGQRQVLMALTNLYLPPRPGDEVARLARHAIQYVLPGGARDGRESARRATVRHAHDELGLTLIEPHLKPHLTLPDGQTFYRVSLPDLDTDALNEALADERLASPHYHEVHWAPIDQSLCLLGNKPQLHSQEWVAAQVMRALQAGFTEDMLNRAANTSSEPFAKALAQLVLDAPEDDTCPASDEEPPA